MNNLPAILNQALMAQIKICHSFVDGSRKPENLFESYEDLLQRKRAQERRYRSDLHYKSILQVTVEFKHLLIMRVYFACKDAMLHAFYGRVSAAIPAACTVINK